MSRYVVHVRANAPMVAEGYLCRGQVVPLGYAKFYLYPFDANRALRRFVSRSPEYVGTVVDRRKR